MPWSSFKISRSSKDKVDSSRGQVEFGKHVLDICGKLIVSNDHELMQSEPKSCLPNQNGK